MRTVDDENEAYNFRAYFRDWNVAECVRMLTENPSLANSRDNWHLSDTVLQTACAKGDLAVCELLIAHGAVIDDRNILGDTPMNYACKEGHLEVCKLLFAHGANPREYTVRTGITARHSDLHFAARSGHAHVCAYLLQPDFGIDVDHRNEYGETPLASACHRISRSITHDSRQQDLDTCRMLIEHGANVNNVKSYFGVSILHDMNKKVSPVDTVVLDVLRMLLAHGANILCKNWKKQTPVQEAYSMGLHDHYNIYVGYVADLFVAFYLCAHDDMPFDLFELLALEMSRQLIE